MSGGVQGVRLSVLLLALCLVIGFYSVESASKPPVTPKPTRSPSPFGNKPVPKPNQPKPGPSGSRPVVTPKPKPGPSGSRPLVTPKPKPGPSGSRPVVTPKPKPGPSGSRPVVTPKPKPGPSGSRPVVTPKPKPGPSGSRPVVTPKPKPGPSGSKPGVPHKPKPGPSGSKPVVTSRPSSPSGSKPTINGCKVSMNGINQGMKTEKSILPEFEPVILNPQVKALDGFAFKRPQVRGNISDLVFTTGEAVRLVCTGNGNKFSKLSTTTPVRDVTVTCVGGSQFKYQTGDPQPFSDFTCSKNSDTSLHPTTSSTCRGSGLEFIEIGFQLSRTEFVKLIDVCFDKTNLDPKWTRFDLLSEIGGKEVGFLRPNFRSENFPFDAHKQKYPKPKQLATIKQILGDREGGLNIDVSSNSVTYLSRGHLAASSDFIFNIQKSATFYLINAAPQWFAFNSGIWETAESAARAYAAQKSANLVVFTGIHGNDNLPDGTGVERNLYLDVGSVNRMKAPALYWKVLYDADSKKGIAMIGINHGGHMKNLMNYATLIALPGMDLCRNKHVTRNVDYWGICNASTDKKAGFGYCCEVDDIRDDISFPRFQVRNVLTYN